MMSSIHMPHFIWQIFRPLDLTAVV